MYIVKVVERIQDKQLFFPTQIQNMKTKWNFWETLNFEEQCQSNNNDSTKWSRKYYFMKNLLNDYIFSPNQLRRGVYKYFANDILNLKKILWVKNAAVWVNFGQTSVLEINTQIQLILSQASEASCFPLEIPLAAYSSLGNSRVSRFSLAVCCRADSQRSSLSIPN